jgi:ribosome-associated protein
MPRNRPAADAPRASPAPHKEENPAVRGDDEVRFEELPEKETRGAKKRKATQLERLGESLVKLAGPKLERVPMPDDLRGAILEARRLLEKTSARGGYRRQVQLIGKIMRTLDAQPIADVLETLKSEDAPSSAAFRKAEVWRDRLLDGTDDDLDALFGAAPALLAERTHLRQLIRQAKKERTAKAPPHAQRALFRELRVAFLAA